MHRLSVYLLMMKIRVCAFGPSLDFIANYWKAQKTIVRFVEAYLLHTFNSKISPFYEQSLEVETTVTVERPVAPAMWSITEYTETGS